MEPVAKRTRSATSWNAGAERIKGYSALEIIGRQFSTFVRLPLVP